MHILMLSWRDIGNPLGGGAESFLHELGKRLVNKGHSVTLFSSAFPGSSASETRGGIKIIRRGNPWTVHFEAYRWYNKLPADTFDLVIDNFHAIPFFTPLYAKKPVIGVIHEVTRELWFAETFLPITLIGYLLEPLFFLPYRHRHFLAASPSTKEDLLRFGHPKDQITVFFESIDLKPVNRFPKKASFPLLICLSRLSPTKRFEHAIMAMPIVREHVPQAKLLIIGSGKPEYLHKLRTLVRHLHLTRVVKFLGYISEEKKRGLLKKSWLILGTSIREGWGLAITEAASVGTPAVAYNVPGFRNSVRNGKTGILVTPQKPENLAQAVIKLIRDDRLRHRLALEAIQSAKGRNRQKTANQLLPIFKKIAIPETSRVQGKLHVLITSWRDIKSPAAGGAEILTHEIAKRLVRWGHTVTILSPIFPGAKNIEILDGVQILRPSFFYATRPITYLNWPRFLVNASATYRAQLANRVDVVVDQVHGLPSFTPLYVAKPVVLFPLEVANEIWLMEIPFPGNVLGWMIERLYLFLFRNKPFLTISPSTAADLHRFGIQNVRVVTPGIAIPPQKLPPKSKHPSFIYLGRVTKMKRIKDSIQAFTIFHRMHRKSRFHVAGKGTPKYFEELRRYARLLRLGRSIIFHGSVSEPRKYDLLARSWALLSTSVREGWGLNVVEAASVGTPTLAYRIPGIVDTVADGKTGLLTNINSPSALAKKMVLLIEDEERRLAMGKAAKIYAREFSWDKSARQFLKAIRNYLNNETASDAVKQ